MKTSMFCLAAIAFTAASIAGSSAGDRSGAPEGYQRTGETTSCLRFRSIRSIKALDENHLLVQVSGREYYINHTSGRCNSAMRPTNRLEIQSPESQLCRAETVSVVDKVVGHVLSTCILGDFERLEKKTS